MKTTLIKKENTFKIMVHNESIGNIAFLKVKNFWQVSYYLSPQFRDQGIMSKSLTEALSFYKNSLIKASVESDRIDSMRVLLKNGFLESFRDNISSEFIKEN